LSIVTRISDNNIDKQIALLFFLMYFKKVGTVQLKVVTDLMVRNI